MLVESRSEAAAGTQGSHTTCELSLPVAPHTHVCTNVCLTYLCCALLPTSLLRLLQVQCSFDASGRCAVPRDTMLMLPSTRTRIAFNAPTTQGLYTWNA